MGGLIVFGLFGIPGVFLLLYLVSTKQKVKKGDDVTDVMLGGGTLILWFCLTFSSIGLMSFLVDLFGDNKTARYMIVGLGMAGCYLSWYLPFRWLDSITDEE